VLLVPDSLDCALGIRKELAEALYNTVRRDASAVCWYMRAA
jgi:hypothetical protein